MDKNQVIQILIAVIVTIVIFYIMFYVVYANMENAILEINGVCDNMTPETYNITPDHAMCKYNETTGKYDLNITVINDVRT